MTKEELSAWERQKCHRGKRTVQSWKVGFNVGHELLTSWTSLWRVQFTLFMQGLGEHLHAGKMQLGRNSPGSFLF